MGQSSLRTRELRRGNELHAAQRPVLAGFVGGTVDFGDRHGEYFVEETDVPVDVAHPDRDVLDIGLRWSAMRSCLGRPGSAHAGSLSRCSRWAMRCSMPL